MESAELADALRTSIARHAFSGVVSIRRGGRVLYEAAAGYADRSNKIENTVETRFGVASGTKFLTALAVGRLIAGGNLSFDTKLKDCLSVRFPRYSPDITIRHLLTHTSGIPDYYDEEKVTDFDNFALAVPSCELRGPRDYLVLFPDEPMKFQPGQRFSYSNSGYILLGVLIEELTGLKYQEFVEQAIFKPNGMDRSGFFSFDRLPEGTALGYIEEPGGWRSNIYTLPMIGASDGGAYTTAQDLATLWRAFWGCKILPGELVEAYAAPFARAETEGEHTYVGHGLWSSEAPGRRREVYITGCDAGVSFRSSSSRVDDLLVTVLANTTHGAWPVLKDIGAALTEQDPRDSSRPGDN